MMQQQQQLRWKRLQPQQNQGPLAVIPEIVTAIGAGVSAPIAAGTALSTAVPTIAAGTAAATAGAGTLGSLAAGATILGSAASLATALSQPKIPKPPAPPNLASSLKPPGSLFNGATGSDNGTFFGSNVGVSTGGGKTLLGQ